MLKHDHLVEAREPSLPGRTRRRQHLFYPHVAHLLPEVMAENRIAILQQVPWELLKGKGRPLSGRANKWEKPQSKSELRIRVLGDNDFQPPSWPSPFRIP